MRNFLLKLLTPKRRTHIAALMPEGERQAAYLTAPGNALFAAILADLDDLAITKSDAAVDENLPEGALRFRLGGSDALLEFKERLQERQREAQLTQEQLEAKRRAERGEEEDGDEG
jgi:hypothetical protein